MPYQGEGVNDVTTDEQAGLIYVVTCEDHHWMIYDMKAKTFREPDPKMRLTPYAQTLLDAKGRAVVITREFQLARFDPTTNTLAKLEFASSGKPIGTADDKLGPACWALTADAKTAYLIRMSDSTLFRIDLTAEGPKVPVTDLGRMIDGKGFDSRGSLIVGHDGKVYALMRVDNTTGFGKGYLHHLVSHDPVTKMMRDHGVIVVRNPDWFDFGPGKDGKPKPWSHGFHKLPDGKYTPLHAHMALCMAKDRTLYATIIYPFTLMRFEEKDYRVNAKLPRVAVTMGDPAGVGPELCLRVLGEPSIRGICTPVVYGDRSVLQRVARHLGWPEPAATDVNNLTAIDGQAVEPGRVSAACGAAAYRYFTTAIDDALAGRVDAIATAPIHKEALHAAGFPFPGHTEILASRTHAQRSCMMLTAEAITCSLVTVHVGYREVPTLLTVDRILDTIELTAAAMERIRGHAPRLLVCGLNPHAGEHGLFGDREEERIITPAIEAARAKGIDVSGPLPPDTAFLPKYRAAADAYICMYHDQGLIPLKALAFEDAVNVTLGLPIVRTSVDHGTAFDIAWQGIAEVSSLIQAVKLAVRLAQ